MTTATLEKGMIQAKDGKAGTEYLWVSSNGAIGARTQLVEITKDGKAVVKFWVDGYEFNTQPHKVPGSQLLKESEQGEATAEESAEQAAEAAAQAAAAPKPAAKAVQGKAQTKATIKPQAKPAPKPAAAKVAAAPKEAKEPKVAAHPKAYERIAKKPIGEKTPRVTLNGFSFRKDYRARLSPVRAAFCAAAQKETCNCRCAGSLHGQDHKAWFEAEDELFRKSPNGAISALQVLNLVKKFGGVVVHEPKPRGRPKAVEGAKPQAAKAPAKVAAKAPVKAAVKPQVRPSAKAPAKTPAKTQVPA